MPKWVRSDLLFGIEPVVIVVGVSLMFVPWVNESSSWPVGRSSRTRTPGRIAVPALSSQSMAGDGPSTVRLALSSISKLLPESVAAEAQLGFVTPYAATSPITATRTVPLRDLDVL